MKPNASCRPADVFTLPVPDANVEGDGFASQVSPQKSGPLVAPGSTCGSVGVGFYLCEVFATDLLPARTCLLCGPCEGQWTGRALGSSSCQRVDSRARQDF